MKKINKILSIILITIDVYFIYKYIANFEIVRLLLCMLLPIFVFIPRIFKNKINEKLIFIYYIYLFLLLVLGCLARFYNIYPNYDLFTHFIFGIAGSITGLYILSILNMYNEKNTIFNILFMIFTTLALSSLWEIFEYAASIITKDDIQHVLDTGVKDTMEDIISAFICSVIFSFTYLCNKNKVYNIVK